MTMFADRVTYEFVFGTLTAVVIAVAWVVVMVLCRRALAGGGLARDDAPIARATSWFALVALIVTGVVYVAASWPFQHDYHWWVDKRGVVTQVSSRLIPAGDKSVQQRFVVVVDGQPLGVDDTRASLLKPGDRVFLLCHKENEWGTRQAAHGWKCKWNGPAEGVG